MGHYDHILIAYREICPSSIEGPSGPFFIGRNRGPAHTRRGNDSPDPRLRSLGSLNEKGRGVESEGIGCTKRPDLGRCPNPPKLALGDAVLGGVVATLPALSRCDLTHKPTALGGCSHVDKTGLLEFESRRPRLHLPE